MMEMIRIRIVEDNGYYHLEQLARKEWLPLLAENGKPLTFSSRKVAEEYINEVTKTK